MRRYKIAYYAISYFDSSAMCVVRYTGASLTISYEFEYIFLLRPDQFVKSMIMYAVERSLVLAILNG